VGLRGSFRILFLYDVAEAIDLGRLRQLLGPRSGTAKETLPRRTPEYVRFEEPPVVEPRERVTLKTGEQVACSIKYYAFAAVVVQLDVPFDCDWKDLLCHVSRWVDPADIEPQAREVLRSHLERIRPAVVRPTSDWLEEDYLIVNLESVSDGEHPSAEELLREKGPEIAQMVRGESARLAAKTNEEILQASASYYPSDLTVIGSAAAFVYDRPDDAAATSQVLEHAKMQLLEFRYYDGLMTRLLSDVYAALERSRNILLSRWSFPRQAQGFNTIRLDVMELTERIDNAIKFVSDVYYARVYRLAAARMGVGDYRNLVDAKLRTVGELYDFMTDQFNEARSFVIELGIAILALLDVILLLRGR
jgi:hypothetical protein